MTILHPKQAQNFDLQRELLSFIRRKTGPNLAIARTPGDLTVGVEHEFFLFNEFNEPATHAQSQVFLASLAKCVGWHIQESTIEKFGLMIERVSKDLNGGRYTAVKYDHHPHLMEIAFAYQPNIHELYGEIECDFNLLAEVASKIGLKVLNLPHIALSPTDIRILSTLRKFENLRLYRRNLYKFRNQLPDENCINYAAVIAATQTHIGGVDWWNRPRFVSDLYKIESEIVAETYRGLPKDVTSEKSAAIKRWSGYQAVFEGYPLIGYPDLNDWTLEAWVEALMSSPLNNGNDENVTGKTLRDIEVPGNYNWHDFFSKVRDLQLIRPRLFGSIEFRADPAQPSIERIVAVAALRLSSCVGVFSGYSNSRNFTVTRNEWWANIGNLDIARKNEHIVRAAHWLKMRGLSEEKYLRPFYEP